MDWVRCNGLIAFFGGIIVMFTASSGIIGWGVGYLLVLKGMELLTAHDRGGV